MVPARPPPFRVQVHKAGLTAYGGLGTMHPLSNRAWGGVAVVAPKHLNCRFIKEFVAEGCGFVLVGVPGGAGEILVGSVYLNSGVGLQCSPNPEILPALAVELKGCRKWVLGGDWNCPAQDFVKTSLESVMHGKSVARGSRPPTLAGPWTSFSFLTTWRTWGSRAPLGKIPSSHMRPSASPSVRSSCSNPSPLLWERVKPRQPSGRWET